MSAPVLTTLLVANRGEIACRVMRTAKALGLTTVAVHSATDREARHSREADIRVDLGGSKAAESYLQIDKLIAAAKASGAQAIHPGYGFLSENAGFARAIEAAGLIFLGPPASAIDAMGSKSAAKALMETAVCRWCRVITAKHRTSTPSVMLVNALVIQCCSRPRPVAVAKA